MEIENFNYSSCHNFRYKASILSVVHPNWFIFIIAKKIWVKGLLNLFSALGISVSYKEAILFDVSVITHPSEDYLPSGFIQFIFDNVDHNICTLDGYNTLHAMTGIQCTTPYVKHIVSYTSIP